MYCATKKCRSACLIRLHLIWLTVPIKSLFKKTALAHGNNAFLPGLYILYFCLLKSNISLSRRTALSKQKHFLSFAMFFFKVNGRLPHKFYIDFIFAVDLKPLNLPHNQNQTYFLPSTCAHVINSYWRVALANYMPVT